MAIVGIILLVLVGLVIWKMPSQEALIARIMQIEAMIYREATVDEFRLMKEGTSEEKLNVAKDITERLEKAGKLSWKL